MTRGIYIKYTCGNDGLIYQWSNWQLVILINENILGPMVKKTLIKMDRFKLTCSKWYFGQVDEGQNGFFDQFSK